MIAIDKGIPVPPNGAGAPPRYPWKAMEVGDSFFVAGAKTSSIRSGAARTGKTTGRQFLVRAVDGGMRVWRVA